VLCTLGHLEVLLKRNDFQVYYLRRSGFFVLSIFFSVVGDLPLRSLFDLISAFLAAASLTLARGAATGVSRSGDIPLVDSGTAFAA
jgi:hypothetical protein